MKGFIINEKSEYRYLSYQKGLELSHPKWFAELRQTFNFLDVKNYRSIGGILIEPNSLIYFENEEIGNTIKFLETKYQIDFGNNDFMYLDLEDCLKVYNIIPEKENYEILEIGKENNEKVTQPILGYDIGNVGYSIISDSIIFPHWHPIDLTDEEIIKKLKGLNKNCLFSSIEQANDFLILYQTKSWAETGEFSIYSIKNSC